MNRYFSLPLLLFLVLLLNASAGDDLPPESSDQGPSLAKGISSTLAKGSQLVAGNGDISLVWTGEAGNADLFFGKSDFWGVVRGNVTTAGHLRFSCEEVKGGGKTVSQNLGQATITAKSSRANSVLESVAWVAYPQNLVVIELSNTGTNTLHCHSELQDGLSSPIIPVCRGSTSDGSWMQVSPDLVDFQVGNRPLWKTNAPLVGDIAGICITSPEYPLPFLIWHPKDADVRNIGSQPITQDSVHGESVHFTGEGDHRLILGNGCMPQTGFSFTAWVRPETNASDATVFAGIARENPGQYPYFRGFLVHLVDGKPEARLNYFTAHATEALPAGQWSELKATYHDQILTLSVNGKEVASAMNPPASAQMGWDKAVLRSGDLSLPFKGCAPQAILRQRIAGTPVSVNGQRCDFPIEPGKKVRLLVSLVSDRNSPDYRKRAETLALTSEDDTGGLRTAHDAWWNSFWGKSFVEIPDRKVMENWYGSLYLLACCSRGDCPPPGLWYNFIRGMTVNWDGDYTLDYNYQAPFWAALAANHFELADSYDPMLLDHLSRGRSIAENAWRMSPIQQPNSLEKYAAQRDAKPPVPNTHSYKGIYLYTHLIPLPGWSNDYGTFWGQKSNALFCTVNMVQRWRLTRDLEYARKVYPFLKATAEFWDSYLVFQNGRYVSLNDALCEGSGDNTNPATTISFLNLLYPVLIEISEKLGLDADLRPKWSDIISKMSPFTYIPAASLGFLKDAPPDLVRDKSVIRDCEDKGPLFPRSAYFTYKNRKITGSSAGMSCVQTIFPGWSFGLESSQEERNAALNTVTFAAQWYDFNNCCNFYADAALAGYDPTEILSNLDELLDEYEKSDFTISTPGGGTEDVAIVPCALQNMFLQSHQRAIHIFANWPKNLNARFGDLPACGGFLIGSCQKNGSVEYVKVTSRQEGLCHLANPWPGSRVKISGRTSSEIKGTELEIPMKEGESVLLTPLS